MGRSHCWCLPFPSRRRMRREETDLVPPAVVALLTRGSPTIHSVPPQDRGTDSYLLFLSTSLRRSRISRSSSRSRAGRTPSVSSFALGRSGEAGTGADGPPCPSVAAAIKKSTSRKVGASGTPVTKYKFKIRCSRYVPIPLRLFRALTPLLLPATSTPTLLATPTRPRSSASPFPPVRPLSPSCRF